MCVFACGNHIRLGKQTNRLFGEEKIENLTDMNFGLYIVRTISAMTFFACDRADHVSSSWSLSPKSTLGGRSKQRSSWGLQKQRVEGVSHLVAGYILCNQTLLQDVHHLPTEVDDHHRHRQPKEQIECSVVKGREGRGGEGKGR